MKKLFTLLMLIPTLLGLAQSSITVKFTAQTTNGTHLQLDAVEVNDLTHDWSQTLTYPDTTLVLNYIDGISDYSAKQGLSQNFPNPFYGTTETKLYLAEAGQTEIQVVDMKGAVITQTSTWLSEGEHHISISLEEPQLALLCVATPKDSHVIKMLNIGQGGLNCVEVSTVRKEESGNTRGTKADGAGTFELGDMMSYTGTATIEGETLSSAVVTQQQNESETITLVFDFEETTIANVTTNSVSAISYTTAICGGNVTDDGGADVTARGVCWATSQNPTIGGSHTTDGSGTGTFTSNMTGLTENTTYYVRAYATNSKGTAYGEQVTFTTTAITTATIVTSNVNSITTTSATCGGNVTNDGGATVTARGVCWATSQNPTISDSHTTDGSGTGTFTSELTGLSANTTYHVRAYATNSKGTAYGEDKTFTTQAAAPTVTTQTLSEVTTTTAVCGGNVTNDGGATVTARGICWVISTAGHYPTIDDSHTTDGTGTGSFTSNITGLTPGKTYFLRAYATNSVGTSYGLTRQFTTYDISTPTVTTSNPSNIGTVFATIGGNVTDDGGAEVTARGVCWSTNQNPTISNSHTSDGTGTGSFTSSMTNLTDGITYYVRAYATNSKGTAYGEQKTFVTKTIPTGCISFLFSVSSSKKVYFSKGNLQYQASTGTWRFADSQTSIAGSNNANISSSYSGWIDLFGWGTGSNPTTSSTSNSSYTTFNDWGNNPISNGGNTANIWRTLSYGEWDYLLVSRETYSGYHYAKATVNGVKGLIILPDEWRTYFYTLNSLDTPGAAFSVNTISSSTWTSSLENHGAVFLPAAGYRTGTTYTANVGHYWSSTSYTSDNAQYMFFEDNTVDTHYHNRFNGFSVRLVSDAN